MNDFQTDELHQENLLKKINFNTLNVTLNKGYTIFPLGDAAATLDLGNTINEQLNDKIIAIQHWMLAHAFAGQKDIIVAYSSLTVIYDPVVVQQKYAPPSTVYKWVAHQLTQACESAKVQPVNEKPVIQIPVCYDGEFAPDLQQMAASKKIDPQEIIALHTAAIYRVYTIGFLPGFSYMAQVHDKLITPRKPKPMPVAAGSVGIAGAQTGIYPLNSPGGWHIIGRTPVKQFDAAEKDLVKLKVGDRVQFYAISEEQYGMVISN